MYRHILLPTDGSKLSDKAARQAIALLGDGEALRAARQTAVRSVQGFSAERIVPRYEALYRRVLGR